MFGKATITLSIGPPLLVCYCFDTCFLAIAVASFSAYTLLRDVFFYFVLCLFVCIVLPVEVNKVVQLFKYRAVSYHTAKLAHRKAKKWLSWQRLSAPLDPI